MENQTIKHAIEEHRETRLRVYKADPNQVVRDTRAADRASKDHAGRWLFELLQNSEDAQASEVRIVIDNDTLYVADNGCGLKPKAVSAISSTDFSDKTTGTIGRKGVGFKSVYEISRNPQVLTVGGGGIEFSHEKTKEWLRQNSLNDDYVPYQWIPFFISWDDATKQDPQLLKFQEQFKTVVRLPLLSPQKKHEVEELLTNWPPHALFAFRHLRQITAPGLEVVLSAGDGVWSLRDSRVQTPVEWRVAKHTERPPDDRLDGLGKDERRFITTDGVSFLIAAPLENNRVVPTSDYLPVHVFYPTEQKAAVPLLLHAEFLVKSDRTAIMPMDDNPFNAWVADRLAYHICKFVNDSYRPESPSSHAALLVPFPDRTSHPVAESLWRRIADEAKKSLLLADVQGCQRLSLDEARLVSVSVCPDLARALLEATSVRGQLLHPSFDDDKDARKALRELGCEEIDDQDLMAAIAGNADSLAADTQWVWACWEWVAAWVGQKPYGKEHDERIKQARSLPLVPVEGRLLKASDLAGRIVTWRPDARVGNLPDWLPLTFVEDWFRDCIKKEIEKDSAVGKLSKKLGIEEPGADVIQRAVGQAIEQYWKDKQGDPGRFLDFVMKQNWHEMHEASQSLRKCPVPLSQPVQGETWAEARKAYFGREWGNDLLADLYEGRDSVAWVKPMGENAERKRSILAWLGCAGYPRIIEDRGPNRNGIVAYALPDECRAWQTREFGNTDFRTPTVDAISCLEDLTIDKLSDNQVRALLVLLAKYWTDYYERHSKVKLSWFYYTQRWRFVRAFWWFQILHELRPATKSRSEASALADCWLPDTRTAGAIGELLPVVDIDVFGSDKDAVREWLTKVVGLRTQIGQVTVDEWKALLSRDIPDKAPAERLVPNEGLRDKVTRWYMACLETVAEQENVSPKAFASCPLMCRKGTDWQYVANEPRYLDDDNELSSAFAEEVWLFHIPDRLADDAVKYFCVLPLSKSVEVNVTPEEPQSQLPNELNERFSKSLPFVYAWRSSQSKKDAESLPSRLKSLQVFVVSALKASLSLNGLRREVERRWHVNDRTIFLHKDHANETELAQALAKALHVRSEEDFYENLLRCTDDRQRKEKLLSKGIADAEIERCLREYSGPPAEEEHDEGPGKPTEVEQGPSQAQHLDQPRVAQGNTLSAAAATARSGLLAQRSSGENLRSSRSESLVNDAGAAPCELSTNASEITSSSSNQTVSLKVKNVKNTGYKVLDARVARPMESNTSRTPSGRAAGAGPDPIRSQTPLTQQEKDQLEEAAIWCAMDWALKKGYEEVHDVHDKEHFDVLAKKRGERDLHIEVKAHRCTGYVVELTINEYEEYKNQEAKGYSWVLCNVEHLAEGDRHETTLDPKNVIPEDAFRVQAYKLDLRRCKFLPPTA